MRINIPVFVTPKVPIRSRNNGFVILTQYEFRLRISSREVPIELTLWGLASRLEEDNSTEVSSKSG